MNKAVFLILILLIPRALFPADKTVVLKSGQPVSSLQPNWLYDGTEQLSGFRGGKDIVLSSSAYDPDTRTDLLLHFDSESTRDATGNWSISSSPAYKITKLSFAGAGAGSFSGPGSKLALKPPPTSVFGPGAAERDFSIEFWLCPANVEDGEIVFSWSSSILQGGMFRGQSAICTISGSKLAVSFRNLFSGPSGKTSELTLKGKSILIPRIWGHHIIRFDSDTGLLEYAMNGIPEAVVHATETGKEEGTVLLPVVGTGGAFELGVTYSGLVDEFRISRFFVAQPTLRSHDFKSGIAFSPVVDLKYTNSSLMRIEARKTTPGNSGIEFSVRSGDTSGGWSSTRPEWVPVREGENLSGRIRGRFVQVKSELFPDGAGGQSPALSEITLVYREDGPPPPPAKVMALPMNGGVKVSWTIVPESDLGGYYIYYGNRPGDYSGTGSSLGPSPIDIGKPAVAITGATSTFTVPGLDNGTLWFFAVAAYDSANPPHVSEFSREVSARPSRTAP